MRRTIRAVTVVAMLAAAAIPSAATGAGATTPLMFRIQVRTDMSADGIVFDDLFDGSYTGTLAAAGFGLCGPTGPEIVLHDLDAGSGNPLLLYTDRACVPYAGEATYVLEWATSFGVSGAHQVQCVWVTYRMTCTPAGTTLSLPRR